MNEFMETFRKAAIENKIVIAEVFVLDTQSLRVRIGPVASVTPTHVTIFDIGKGFRTTPIECVRSARIQQPETSWFGNLWRKMWGAA